MNMRQNQERNGLAAVSLTFRVERLETSRRAKPRNTTRAAVTHSNAGEWTRNAGARVTPFNLQTGLHRRVFNCFRGRRGRTAEIGGEAGEPQPRPRPGPGDCCLLGNTSSTSARFMGVAPDYFAPATSLWNLGLLRRGSKLGSILSQAGERK
jgi:hypothetical protein